MKILKEFRDFAVKGNVVDLAVGVVIGTAFGKIVSSVVDDLAMPLMSQLTGGLDFSNMYYNFGNPLVIGPLVEARKIGAVIAWGNFVTIILNFVIIAFCIFIVIKAMNRAIPKKPPTPPTGPTDIELLSEIRDLIRQRPL